MTESGKTWLRAGAMVAVGLALAGLWQIRPIREFLDPASLAGELAPYRTAWWAGLAVLFLYLVLEAVCFPLLLLVLVTGIAFGPVLGSCYALVGTMAAAVEGFLAGRALGRRKVERLLGKKAKAVAGKVARNGILSVFLIRKIPAPYSLVNVILGATAISFRDFMVGTLLGLGVMVVVVAVVGHQLVLLRENPSLQTVLLLASCLVVPFIIAWAVNRRLRSQRAAS